ncbi:putative L-galactonate transporter [bacterium HR33]|nr:putative L-galactonate transporter [bacterium HR33]
MSADPRIAAQVPGFYAWYALALLTLINAVNFIDRNIIFALFEPIKDELDLSDAQLGWLGSAYIIVFSVAAIPLGILSDLKSRRAVIASGVTLWAVFTGMAGLARHYWQLLFCRSMVGVGEAAYSPAAQSLLADYFPQRGRALALGIFWSGLAVGGVAGIWLGGELAHLYGWRAAFLAVGLPGLLLAMLASRLRDPTRRIRPFSLGDAIRRFELTVWHLLVALWPLWVMGGLGLAAAYLLDRSGWVGPDVEGAVLGAAVALGVVATAARGIRAILAHRHDELRPATLSTLDDFVEAAKVVMKTPTLVWVFLGGALISFAMNGLVGWSPSYMQRELGLPPQVAGRTIGAWGLAAGLLGVVFGGKLGDKLAERWDSGRVIAGCAGFLAGGPLCIWLLSVRDLEAFIPLFFVTLFLFTWYHGPVSATIFDVVPARVGASVMGAYVFFTHMAGDAIAYPLIGAFSDRFGIRIAMLVLPVVGLIGGAVFLMAARTVARDVKRARQLVS